MASLRNGSFERYTAIVLAITVVNFAWTFHPSFVIVKPLLLSISMVLFVTMQM